MHRHNWDYRAVLLALFLSCGTAFAQGTPSAVIGGPPQAGQITGIVPPAKGGTGINNGTNTLTLNAASIINLSGATGGDAICFIGGAVVDCGVFPVSVGTGLSLSGTTVNNNAVEHISYQPGLLTAVNATKAVFHKFSKAATVDNIEGSAATFSCVSNPTITVFECGTSTTCASSPVTIGTVTVTAAGAVVDGTVSSAAITAGDYVAFAMTAGTCASVDIAATIQVHSN